jgi:hypothetical protein
VSISRQVFGCPTCGNRFTPPLRRLPEALRVRSGARCCEAPEGFYVVHDAPMDRPGCGVAVNPHDVRNVIPHPDPYRRAGCCGVSYVTRLPNLRCARCGDDVGYELSDGDHAEHVIYLPTQPRAEVPCDEPGDASVMARAEARWRIPDPAPADEGLDALPARLRVEVDTLFEREPQDPSRFPALHDVGVAVHAREVRLFLDGVCVRPPWPEGERDRVVALGAIPGGGRERAAVLVVHGARARERPQPAPLVPVARRRDALRALGPLARVALHRPPRGGLSAPLGALGAGLARGPGLIRESARAW